MFYKEGTLPYKVIRDGLLKWNELIPYLSIHICLGDV